VVVVRVVKVAVKEKRVVWILELNRTPEVLKTESLGYPMTFHH
jgi:hypothetical protein